MPLVPFSALTLPGDRISVRTVVQDDPAIAIAGVAARRGQANVIVGDDDPRDAADENPVFGEIVDGETFDGGVRSGQGQPRNTRAGVGAVKHDPEGRRHSPARRASLVTACVSVGEAHCNAMG